MSRANRQESPAYAYYSKGGAIFQDSEVIKRMNRSDAAREVKTRYADYLQPAKKRIAGKPTYICPLCGNGSGKNGDGMSIDPHGDGTQLKCFKCGFYGDIVDLYQQQNNCDVGAAFAVKEIERRIAALEEYRDEARQKRRQISQKRRRRRSLRRRRRLSLRRMKSLRKRLQKRPKKRPKILRLLQKEREEKRPKDVRLRLHAKRPTR